MVSWNAEKDQLLLKGVFQFCDIKCNAPLLKHLADMIGEDCTPKAVSHRLNNIKNSGKATKNAGNSATSTPAKTPGSGARGRGCPSKIKNLGSDVDVVDDEEVIVSPSINRKRGRKPKKSAEDAKDEEIERHAISKKVKMEPGELEHLFAGIGAHFEEHDGNMIGDEI